MEALVRAAAAEDYPARICGVFSNRPDAAGLETAARAGLATAALDHRSFPDRTAFDTAIDAQMIEWGADLIACAGFMRIFSDVFISRWQGRMINIHPALLPLFRGLDTHQRALDAGVRLHGCTSHFVTLGVDEGPIILQAAVPVLPDDGAEALAARVLRAEHRVYPETLRLVASGKVALDGNRVRFAEAAYDPAGYLGPVCGESTE